MFNCVTNESREAGKTVISCFLFGVLLFFLCKPCDASCVICGHETRVPAKVATCQALLYTYSCEGGYLLYSEHTIL